MKKDLHQKLEDVGACFATSGAKVVLPNDGFGARPSYHIHPDAQNPRQRDVLRFSTLAELHAYLDARLRSQEATTDAQAVDIMESYWMERK